MQQLKRRVGFYNLCPRAQSKAMEQMELPTPGYPAQPFLLVCSIPFLGLRITSLQPYALEAAGPCRTVLEVLESAGRQLNGIEYIKKWFCQVQWDVLRGYWVAICDYCEYSRHRSLNTGSLDGRLEETGK